MAEKILIIGANGQIGTELVQALREQLNEEKPDKPHVKLPVWSGSVKGALRREQIYDDVG